MVSIEIDVNSHLGALLAASLGHRPNTIEGGLAVRNFLVEKSAENPTGEARNAFMAAAIIDALVRPEVAAEWRRWKADGKRFVPALPKVEAVAPLTERQKAKRLRNQIYADLRAQKVGARAEKAAAKQARKDEMVSALLDAEAVRAERTAKAEPCRRLGFA